MADYHGGADSNVLGPGCNLAQERRNIPKAVHGGEKRCSPSQTSSSPSWSASSICSIASCRDRFLGTAFMPWHYVK